MRSLYGLRFLAAGIVVVFHVAPHSWWALGPLGKLVGAGYVGSTLLFFVSGLTLAVMKDVPAGLRGSVQLLLAHSGSTRSMHSHGWRAHRSP